MKKLNIVALVATILVSSFFFTSCKKNSLPSMKASFDGTAKNFMFRSTIKGSVPKIGEGFVIIGRTIDPNSGDYLTILIRGVDTKTYNLTTSIIEGKFECEAIYRINGLDDEGNTYVAKTGTVTISEINTKKDKISGSFQFDLVNKLVADKVIKVTEGEFKNLKFVKATLPTDIFDL